MDSQESSPTLQFKSISSSTPRLPYGPTLTYIFGYWKTIALITWTHQIHSSFLLVFLPLTFIFVFFFLFISISAYAAHLLLHAVYFIHCSSKHIYHSWCSVPQSCQSLCNPMDCSKPGFSVFHHLLEFAQTHVHWVSDTIQPSCPPILVIVGLNCQSDLSNMFVVSDSDLQIIYIYIYIYIYFTIWYILYFFLGS